MTDDGHKTRTRIPEEAPDLSGFLRDLSSRLGDDGGCEEKRGILRGVVRRVAGRVHDHLLRRLIRATGHDPQAAPWYPVAPWPSGGLGGDLDGSLPSASPPRSPDRVVLPMGSGVRVRPRTSAQITSRPQTCAFQPKRVLIGGHPERWVVNDIKIGRSSQFAQAGDVPGEMFAAGAVDCDVKFDVAPTAVDVVMIVTYVGSDPEGEVFAAGIIGNAATYDGAWDAELRFTPVHHSTPARRERGVVARVARLARDLLAGDRRTDEPREQVPAPSTPAPQPAALRLVLPVSSGCSILPNTSAQITARPQTLAFRPERIVIGGAPGDWIVNDIRVGNRSQFSQAGDIPGEAFTATTIDNFVSFETVQTAMDFQIIVTYIGSDEAGAPFVCGVLGATAA